MTNDPFPLCSDSSALTSALTRALFQDASDAILIIDKATARVVDCNPAAARLIESPRESILNTNISHLIIGTRGDAALVESLTQCLPIQADLGCQLRSAKVDGAIPVSVRIAPLETGNGLALCLVTLRDQRGSPVFTRSFPQPAVEAASPENDERNRLLFQNMPIPVWIFDLVTLKFLAVNEAAIRHYGYSRDEFLAMTIMDIRPAEDVPKLAEVVTKIRLGDRTGGQWRHRKKDGSIIDVEITGYSFVFNGHLAETIVAVDITQRKRDEASARRRLFELTLLNQIGAACATAQTSDEMLASCTDLIADSLFPHNCGFVLLDEQKCALVPQASFRYANPATDRSPIPIGKGVIGSVMQTGIARRITDVGADHDYWAADSLTRSELCVPLRIGTQLAGVINVESTEANAFSPADEQLLTTVANLVGSRLARLEAKESLRRSEEHFRALVENSFDGINILNPDGSIRYSSPLNARLLGYEPEVIQGRNAFSFAHPDDFGTLKVILAASLQDRDQVFAFSCCVEHNDGRPRWIEGKVRNMLDHPAVGGLVVNWRDITERKHAEEELRASEMKLRAIIDAQPECVKLISPDGFLLEMNPAGLAMLGVSSLADARCVPLFDFIAPAYREAYNELHLRVISGSREELEFELVSLKGVRRWMTTSAVPLRGENGEVIAHLAITRDITERKRIENQLRDSESRYRTFVENSTDAIFLHSSSGVVLDVNNRACESLGFSREELVGMMPYQYDPDITEEMMRKLDAQLEHGDILVFDSRHRRKDGTLFPVEVRIGPFVSGGIRFGLAMVHDITERKRIENELRTSETFLRLTQQAGQCGSWERNFITGTIQVSDEVYRIHGITPADFDSSMESVIRLVHPDDRDRLIALSQAPQIGGEIEAIEYRIVRPDGDVRTIWIRGTRLFDADGNPERNIGTVTDITDRKSMEESLQKTSAFREAIIQTAAEGICACFGVAEFPYIRFSVWNDRMTEITGYTLAEINELGWYQSMYPDPDVQCRAVERMDRMRAGDNLKSEEWEITRKDGTHRVVAISTSLVELEAGIQGVVALMHDVTERRRAEKHRQALEAQMQHAQKLESLGVLAGGIAHDFNNLLTSMLGCASLAQSELPPGTKAHGLLNEIEKAALSAADLTHQMLAYAGKAEFVSQPIQLDAIARDLSQLLTTVVARKAKLQLDLRPAPTHGDVSQIKQVVMNLITNAADALTGDGIVTLRTGVRHADASLLRSPYNLAELPEGTYAFLEVKDNGCGMTEETLSRIFDPFFTTKFTGRGLGLAALLGIVRGHRGALHVESQVGVGTTFLVLFPAAENLVTGPKATSALAKWQGSGSVLVIDDEPQVRNIAQLMLKTFGFSVITARGGREGIDIFQQHADTIAVVLLDITMPDLDGVATLHELRRIRPDVRVLFSSGYGEQDARQQLGTVGISGFVAKPYRLEDLRNAMRDALAE